MFFLPIVSLVEYRAPAKSFIESVLFEVAEISTKLERQNDVWWLDADMSSKHG